MSSNNPKKDRPPSLPKQGKDEEAKEEDEQDLMELAKQDDRLVMHLKQMQDKVQEHNTEMEQEQAAEESKLAPENRGASPPAVAVVNRRLPFPLLVQQQQQQQQQQHDLEQGNANTSSTSTSNCNSHSKDQHVSSSFDVTRALVESFGENVAPIPEGSSRLAAGAPGTCTAIRRRSTSITTNKDSQVGAFSIAGSGSGSTDLEPSHDDREEDACMDGRTSMDSSNDDDADDDAAAFAAASSGGGESPQELELDQPNDTPATTSPTSRNLVEAYLVETSPRRHDDDAIIRLNTATMTTMTTMMMTRLPVVVEDSTPGHLVEAVQVQSSTLMLHQKWKWVGTIMAVLFVTLLAIAIAVPVTSARGTTNQQDTKDKLPQPTEPSFVNLWNTTAATTVIQETEIRVWKDIGDFLATPTIVLDILERFIHNGEFPHDLDVRDRDAFMRLIFSLKDGTLFHTIYYGSEFGLFMGYLADSGIYREPSNNLATGISSSLYKANDPTMQKYYHACVNGTTGEPVSCTIDTSPSSESQMVQCVDNCSLVPCPVFGLDGDNDNDDDNDFHPEYWCPHYEVVQVMPTTINIVGDSNNSDQESQRMGYIPMTVHCYDSHGVFSQEPGAILQRDGSLGDCMFGDRTTLVNRSLTDNYQYCQNDGNDNDDDDEQDECNIFVGGYRSLEFDPRHRPWYTACRDRQKPIWTLPYIFARQNKIGLTFSAPHHVKDKDQDRFIFKGVFGFDYTLDSIEQTIRGSYETEHGVFVAVYETIEPYHLLAASTGRNTTQMVLKSLDEDNNGVLTPCPDVHDDNNRKNNDNNDNNNLSGCVPARISMTDLEGEAFDNVLQSSFLQHQKLGFPNKEVVEVQVVESDVNSTQQYLSQASLYTSEDHILQWTILVIARV